jgi:hypothetical protein
VIWATNYLYEVAHRFTSNVPLNNKKVGIYPT